MGHRGRSLTTIGEICQTDALEDDSDRKNRLEELRKGLKGQVRLALHGTNGFPPEIMKKCIAGGLCKINVNKLSLSDYYEDLERSVGKKPHTTVIEQGIAKVRDQTVRWMEICGSAGKA